MGRIRYARVEGGVRGLSGEGNKMTSLGTEDLDIPGFAEGVDTRGIKWTGSHD